MTTDVADADLGETAAAGLGDVPEEVSGSGQETLEGTDLTMVKFLGVRADVVRDDFKIGDEVTFVVRGRVIEVGDRQMKDNHQRHVVGIDVESVVEQD